MDEVRKVIDDQITTGCLEFVTAAESTGYAACEHSRGLAGKDDGAAIPHHDGPGWIYLETTHRPLQRSRIRLALRQAVPPQHQAEIAGQVEGVKQAA